MFGHLPARLLSFVFAALCFGSMHAADWPQFLGPTRDAVYSGPALSEKWPASGPRVVWRTQLGQGYSSPVVSGGKLVIAHRVGNSLTVDCFDALTGTTNWSFKQPMTFQDGAYFDSGPRATPAIMDGRVFLHNTDGDLVCLDLASGKKLWSRQVKAEFQSSATWHGCVASPLLTERALILPVGGSNSAVVAFAPKTGDVLWQKFDEKATAVSPLLANLGGRSQLLVVTRTAFRGLDPETGEGLWSVPTKRQTTGDVYAAEPMISGDLIFLSGWYKLGATLFRYGKDGPEKVWENDSLSTHYASAIIHKDHVYGFHGHAWEQGGPVLRCIELATGKVKWEQPRAGSGTIVRSGDNLLILFENGELQMAKADPAGFKAMAHAQIVPRVTRSYPAVVDGYVYLRGPRQLVCLDLRQKN